MVFLAVLIPSAFVPLLLAYGYHYIALGAIVAYLIAAIVGFVVGAGLRTEWWHKKFIEREIHIGGIVERWNDNKFRPKGMELKLGPLAAWVEIRHQIVEFGVYGALGELRGFPADTDAVNSPIASRGDKINPRGVYDSWSVSKTNTIRNGPLTPNYFVTPEASITPRDHFSKRNCFIDQSFAQKDILECNSVAETDQDNMRATKSSRVQLEAPNTEQTVKTVPTVKTVKNAKTVKAKPSPDIEAYSSNFK